MRAAATRNAIRYEGFAGNVGQQFKVRRLPFRGRRNIQQNQFIDFFVVEDLDDIDRVAEVGRVLEPNRLDKSSIAEEQTGNYAGCQHGDSLPTKFRSNRMPNLWLFSG